MIYINLISRQLVKKRNFFGFFFFLPTLNHRTLDSRSISSVGNNMKIMQLRTSGSQSLDAVESRVEVGGLL